MSGSEKIFQMKTCCIYSKIWYDNIKYFYESWMQLNYDISRTTDLKKNNRNTVYRYIYHNSGCATKQLIASDINLSLPTVTQSINQLMEDGLVAYEGTSTSTGGRKARLLTICSNARFAIGVSISRKHLRFVVINLRNEIIAYRKATYSFIGGEELFKDIHSQIKEILSEHHIDCHLILGVGIAIPGIISADRERIVYAPTLHMKNVSIPELTKEFTFDVLFENDANAGSFAEWMGVEEKNIAFLSLDRGVGGAISLNAKQYEGDNMRAAEFGHMCIEPNGRKCSCGRYGCLEAYCSSDVLSENRNCSLDDFFAHMNQEENRNIFEQYLNYLVRGLDNIIMLLDCKVVIGGSVADFLSDYISIINQKIALRDVFNQNGQYVYISKYKSNAASMGSAMRFVARFMENR